MSVKVKICGVRSVRALDAALEAGADYIGLVFYPPSPRHVDVETARTLSDRVRGRVRSVALLVDPDDAEVRRVVEAVQPDLIQLHGSESPQRVRAVRALAGCPVVKAVKVDTEADAQAARDYDGAADLVLYDAKEQADATNALPGGNGVPFDWEALTGVAKRGDFVLSGGLTPENVADAIRLTGAPMVDVSSGVERAPGEKDPELIRRFVAAAKAVAPEDSRAS